MKLQDLDNLGPDQLRQLLTGFLASRLDGVDPAAIAPLIARFSDDDLDTLRGHLGRIGGDHVVYDAHDPIRALSRAYLAHAFPDHQLSGADHLRRAIEDGPTVIVLNHLSYVDANAVDAALAWAGDADLADRIVVLAGPKVYREAFRLLAAAAISTLPVPQSTRLDHTDRLNRRELARRALESVAAADRALQAGRALLFFPEGSRTRTGVMGPWLKATHRYLRGARFVVPAAITGTEQAMPLDAVGLRPAALSLAFAPAIDLERADARRALARAHRATAELLPEAYRPAAGSERIC